MCLIGLSGLKFRIPAFVNKDTVVVKAQKKSLSAAVRLWGLNSLRIVHEIDDTASQRGKTTSDRSTSVDEGRNPLPHDNLAESIRKIVTVAIAHSPATTLLGNHVVVAICKGCLQVVDHIAYLLRRQIGTTHEQRLSKNGPDNVSWPRANNPSAQSVRILFPYPIRTLLHDTPSTTTPLCKIPSPISIHYSVHSFLP